MVPSTNVLSSSPWKIQSSMVMLPLGRAAGCVTGTGNRGACSWTATRLALNSFAEKPKPTLEGWRCRTCENGKQKRRQHFRRCWYELPFIGWWFYLASPQLCFRDWGDEMCGGVSGMMSRRNQSIAYPVFFGQRISRYIRIHSS